MAAMTKNHKNPKNLLSLGALRLVAIVAPISFAVALGLTTDLVLRPNLSGSWAAVVATLIVSVGAVVFSFFIFRLLRGVYGRIDEQNRELERGARELRKATEAERARAEEWKALFELGEEVTASPDVQKLLDSIVQRARRILSTDVATLTLASPDGEQLRLAAHSGLHNAGGHTLLPIRERGVQALVLEAGAPVIVEDYKSDERLRGRQAGLVKEEGLVSLIAVPFSGEGRLLGTLTVGNRKRTPFTAHQAELLRSFSHWTAVVVETARLHERLRSLALLEERERIGMDLHDGVIQSIYAVVLRLDDFSERSQEPTEELRAGLNKAIDDLNQVIQDIRGYIFDLRPGALQGDLPRALEELVQGVRVNTLMDANLDVEGEPNGALSEEQAAALFHIAREALSNVTRHAKASSLKVRLQSLPRSLRLEISDNGVGFDPRAERGEDTRGLHNMAERARALGAELALHSDPGHGTRVTIELPLESVRQ
jgi:signal transduction histidine kinase